MTFNIRFLAILALTMGCINATAQQQDSEREQRIEATDQAEALLIRERIRKQAEARDRAFQFPATEWAGAEFSIQLREMKGWDLKKKLQAPWRFSRYDQAEVGTVQWCIRSDTQIAQIVDDETILIDDIGTHFLNKVAITGIETSKLKSGRAKYFLYCEAECIEPLRLSGATIPRYRVVDASLKISDSTQSGRILTLPFKRAWTRADGTSFQAWVQASEGEEVVFATSDWNSKRLNRSDLSKRSLRLIEQFLLARNLFRQGKQVAENVMDMTQP
ncbi:MAG: hypothetical protein AAGJ83_00270 [Planctomycetota bacterium]